MGNISCLWPGRSRSGRSGRPDLERKHENPAAVEKRGRLLFIIKKRVCLFDRYLLAVFDARAGLNQHHHIAFSEAIDIDAPVIGAVAHGEFLFR
jgi:hypothetical protein